MTAQTWHAVGSVRGHAHRTEAAAEACALRDQRRCASLGGGAYSDRAVHRGDCLLVLAMHGGRCTCRGLDGWLTTGQDTTTAAAR